MVRKEKNSETKKLPQLRIYIRLVLWIAGLAAVAGLIHAFGATFGTVAAVWLGYRVLRLVLRLIGLILSILFTAVSIVILIAIISLIII
jgi:hypothetical protein